MSSIPSGISPDNINLSPASFGYPTPRVGKAVTERTGAPGFNQELDLRVNGLKATVSEPLKQAEGSHPVRDLIMAVDEKAKTADAMRASLLSGESNNLHQTMIASQEASVSFTLLLEMRNKVMETYQELMRLQL